MEGALAGPHYQIGETALEHQAHFGEIDGRHFRHRRQLRQHRENALGAPQRARRQSRQPIEPGAPVGDLRGPSPHAGRAGVAQLSVQGQIVEESV